MSPATSRFTQASLGLALLLTSAAAFADRCEFSASRNLDVDAAGIRQLAIEFGSDDLNLNGVPGLASIEVRGRACASSQAALDSMKLQQKRDGARVAIKVNKDDISSSWFGSNYAYIDLQVRVPQSLMIEIKRGSGDVVIENVAGVDSTAGSGDLDARDIAGAVLITAGSGDSELRNVAAVTVRALGSGDVRAKGVSADVQVESCGSGDLDFIDVSGNVSVGRIGSGDIELSRIGRDVRVGSIGSGDITADDVGGNLVVESKGSGGITHNGVKGRVDIPKRR